jgi:hypothetical protein
MGGEKPRAKGPTKNANEGRGGEEERGTGGQASGLQTPEHNPNRRRGATRGPGPGEARGAGSREPGQKRAANMRSDMAHYMAYGIGIGRHSFMYNESLELTAPQHTVVKI